MPATQSSSAKRARQDVRQEIAINIDEDDTLFAGLSSEHANENERDSDRCVGIVYKCRLNGASPSPSNPELCRLL